MNPNEAYTMTNDQPVLTLETACRLAKDLHDKVAASIFGQEQLITEAICCLISGGHILMTGAPGLAKTTLVRVFARYLKLNYGRIQFTPDLLPSDIIGSDILNIDTQTGRRHFEFAEGPVFVNLLLADEINRASPRTQSALLEAMQERSCTVGGRYHALPSPFMVFATQNPFESEGAFPLPEAQLDRFLLHTLVDYPSEEAEERILKEHASNQLIGEQHGESLTTLQGEEVSLENMNGLIATRQKIHLDEGILQLIRDLIRSTRPQDESCPEDLRSVIWYGAGPRAGISLISVARALAMLDESETVRWHHVRRMAKPVLRHRIRLTAQAGQDQFSEDDLIDRLIERLEDKSKLASQGVTA
jgi:MoxR-like ATPase